MLSERRAVLRDLQPDQTLFTSNVRNVERMAKLLAEQKDLTKKLETQRVVLLPRFSNFLSHLLEEVHRKMSLYYQLSTQSSASRPNFVRTLLDRS